jgi:gluconolactonase
MPMSTTTIINDEISFPEGPLLYRDGTWLVTELDLKVGTVTRITREGKRDEIAKTGRPNGLALQGDGTVWVAESLEPALLRLNVETGQFAAALTEVEGVPLQWPNDLCFGPDGNIYATDSGVLVGDFLEDSLVKEGATELPIDGRVLGFNPATGDAWFLDRGLGFANGIAFGPDGLLYANETYSGNIYRYALDERGRLVGERETFGNVHDPEYTEPGMRGPDGMAFSTDGRLWTAVFGQGDVTVLNPDGSFDHRIKLDGKAPTNLAFGPDGDTNLYIVEDERGTFESVEVGVGGFPLHS